MDLWENVSDFAREFFWEMGEFILTFGGVGGEMVCLVVMMAP